MPRRACVLQSIYDYLLQQETVVPFVIVEDDRATRTELIDVVIRAGDWQLAGEADSLRRVRWPLGRRAARVSDMFSWGSEPAFLLAPRPHSDSCFTK